MPVDEATGKQFNMIGRDQRIVWEGQHVARRQILDQGEWVNIFGEDLRVEADKAYFLSQGVAQDMEQPQRVNEKPGLLPRVTRATLAIRGLMDCFDIKIEGTAERIAKFWDEFNQPQDLTELMKTFIYEEPANGGQPLVALSGIPLSALCEHHACPFYGTFDIGYIPKGRVLGLSKFARLAHAAGRRSFTIQERLTNDMADAIDRGLDPGGVIVVGRATHTCMSCRGVNTPGVITITSAIRGAFVHNPAARQEFFSLLGGK